MKEEYRALIKKLNKDFSKIKNKELRLDLKKTLVELNHSIYGVYVKAIIDQKTGLYNNYFFETLLKMEIEKAERGKQKLSLFILDIDFFKKINDTYGHIKADEMLVRLATIVVKNTRKSDVVARFGGEEFIALFPETPIDKAKKVISRMRNEIKKDFFLKRYSLTVSGGLTEFKKGDTSYKIKFRADKGLYKAKKQGRDQFVIEK